VSKAVAKAIRAHEEAHVAHIQYALEEVSSQMKAAAQTTTLVHKDASAAKKAAADMIDDLMLRGYRLYLKANKEAAKAVDSEAFSSVYRATTYDADGHPTIEYEVNKLAKPQQK
jgi:hypothetical protein